VIKVRLLASQQVYLKKVTLPSSKTEIDGSYRRECFEAFAEVLQALICDEAAVNKSTNLSSIIIYYKLKLRLIDCKELNVLRLSLR